MFDRTQYDGFISNGFNPHGGNIEVENIYAKDEQKGSQISLDYGYTVRSFLYDMKYIEEFKFYFNTTEYLQYNLNIDLKKEKLILELKEKWEDICDDSIFKTTGVAKVYKKELDKYLDTSFIDFSDNYYLKGSFSFTRLNKTPDLSNQPSDKKFIQELYDTHKNNSLLIELEEAMDINNDSLLNSEKPNIEHIYYIDDTIKKAPKIYELDIDNVLFQMQFIKKGFDISNLYFQFENILLYFIPSEYSNSWKFIYSEVSNKFIQEGKYFMPSIIDNKVIRIKDDTFLELDLTTNTQ
jgi:hypothetical protein